MQIVVPGEPEGRKISKYNISLHEAGFQYLFLELSWYCPETLLEDREKIYCKYAREKRPDDPGEIFLTREPERMEEVVGFYLNHLHALGMKNVIAQAPFLASDTKRTDSDALLYQLAQESLRLCKKIGCGYLIVDPIVKNDTLADDRNRRFYLSLAQEARDCGIMILIKNQCRMVYGHLMRNNYSDAYMINEFIELLNAECGAEVFGHCMDIGVCNLLGQNMREYIMVLKNKIKAVIIRENDGVHAEAQLPFSNTGNGQSKIDYLGLIRGLRSIEFDGLLLYEFRSTRSVTSHLLQKGLAVYAKKIADYFAWQISIEHIIKKYKTRVLFGAGNMCRNYMKCYGETYKPMFTCDNNSAIWGTVFEGLEIKSPEALKTLPEDCVVLICNIYYEEIEDQLREMGIRNPVERFNDEYLPSMYVDRFDADKRETGFGAAAAKVRNGWIMGL